MSVCVHCTCVLFTHDTYVHNIADASVRNTAPLRRCPPPLPVFKIILKGTVSREKCVNNIWRVALGLNSGLPTGLTFFCFVVKVLQFFKMAPS